MQQEQLEMRRWVDFVLKGAGQLAKTVGLQPFEGRGPVPELPGHFRGAHIALVGDVITGQIALLSSDAGNIAIAKTMLSMRPAEVLDNEHVVDAICEITNQLAGLVKRQFGEQDPSLRVGLPMFVEGHVFLPASARTERHIVRLGEHEAGLVVTAGATRG